MLGYHFLSGTTRDNFFTNNSAHGAGVLWSDIAKIPTFSNYQMPLPLVVADSRPAKSGYNGTNSQLNWVVYEFSPFEFGSWDPGESICLCAQCTLSTRTTADVSAFTDVAVTGTKLNAGEPDNSTSCVSGFDQASFVMGTSSSLFNVRPVALAATYALLNLRLSVASLCRRHRHQTLRELPWTRARGSPPPTVATRPDKRRRCRQLAERLPRAQSPRLHRRRAPEARVDRRR